MAFVSALIHQAGCFYPAKGIGSIPRVLMEAAGKAGVEFRFGTKVRTIRTANGRVRGVETEGGEFLESGTVLSNHSGVGTYLDLVDAVPQKVRKHMGSLPLQSPGVCAYLAIQGNPRPPYLRFLLPEAGRERLSRDRALCAPKKLDTSAVLAGQETAASSVRATSRCRLLITPAAVDPTLCRDGWSPARLLGPLDFEDAERLGEGGQREYLEQLLAENWWRENVDSFRVLATRVPADWGSAFHLYRDSMNPVMTARFMRAGRLAHRSPHVRGLYLAGSSTHPGQWVSFCAISGILSADCVIGDLAKC
jgi:phytoene dehydrogenase-like protein